MVGSAWMPCERPMVGVILCSRARRLRAASSASMSRSRRSVARTSCTLKAGVEHVGRGHALVDEARLRADDLGEMGQERDDVVLHLALDRVDALHVEGGLGALLPDHLGRLLRDDAEVGERRRGMGLDLEPDAELGLGRPDGHHLGAAVAGDHRLISSSRRGDRPSEAVAGWLLDGCGERKRRAPRNQCLASVQSFGNRILSKGGQRNTSFPLPTVGDAR